MSERQARRRRSAPRPIEQHIASAAQTALVARDQERFLQDPRLRAPARPYVRGEIGRLIADEAAALYEDMQAHPEQWAMVIVWIGNPGLGSVRIPIQRAQARAMLHDFVASYRAWSPRWMGSYDLPEGEGGAA